MSLLEEIEDASRTISTDSYEMSVGELMNMYRDGEIAINPEFQRLFRWDQGQKSRFIESLLLRIPIPPIFVFETDQGVWELIDGLQRISTILEFTGNLRDRKTGKPLPPSKLVGTTYLPSLNDVVWEITDSSDKSAKSLPKPLQLGIKRARIGIQILEKKSDLASKYDLFQRLNSGGSQATPNELRNCVMVMIDPSFAECVRDLAGYPNFRNTLHLSAEAKKRQQDLDFAIRFLVYRHVQYDKRLDIQDFLDRGVVKVAELYLSHWDQIEENFRETFDLIKAAEGTEGLKKYEAGKFKGRVGLIAFEMIAVGISNNLSKIKQLDNPTRFVRDRIRGAWGAGELEGLSGPGVRGTQRIQKTLPFGKRWFNPKNA